MFHVCSHCAAALVNGDLSFYEDEVMARIEERIESMGRVAMTESVDPGFYFDCEVCEETCIGEIFTFERV